MRIVHTEASLGWGGQELRILSEASGMRSRGHEVTLLCPAQARIFEAARRRGLPVAALPLGRKRPGGVVALARWLGQHQVDVINTHSSTDTWLAALACATRRPAPPIVRTRHISAPLPDNSATRWLYRRATAHVVTTGEALRRELIERNGLPAQRVTSIPTGIDTGLFSPGDRAAARARLGLAAQQRAIVGIVATLRSWKGHRYLLEAFAALDLAHKLLLIVGDGPQRAALEQQARTLGLGDNVLFAGNQEDVLPWLQALDVFALPSYANEGVPQALLQAMLCGLACVTTPVGSIGEAALDGTTALIAAPQDVDSLRAALARLLADPPLRRRLGDAARAHCARCFGFDMMLERMEGVFRDVIAFRRPH